MAEEKTKTGFLGYLTQLMDRFSGDKVIFLIALFLMLISVVSVFSSTPRLVNEGHGIDRVSIMLDQLKVVAIGFCLSSACISSASRTGSAGSRSWDSW